MRFISRALVMFAMAIAIGGCSSLGGKSTEEKTDQAKAKVNWSFEKEGIWLELAAQTDLNFYANRSHSLVLGVWQVEDEKVFVKLMGDPSSVSHALATGTLPKAVLQLDRYVIQPDTRTLLKIDRVQNAKYVGLVAGYYVFEPARSARYYRIPLNIQSTGLISKDYTAEPAILALKMVLGSQRIINAQSLTYDADKKVVLETVPLSNEKLEVELSPEVLNQVAQESSAVIKLGR